MRLLGSSGLELSSLTDYQVQKGFAMNTVGRRCALPAAVLIGCLSFITNVVAGDDCGCRAPRRSAASRIVNGQNVPASQFPTVGQVGDAGFDFCTGTLIGSKYVLSAGHCVTDDNGRPNLTAANARFRLGGVEYRVSQIVVHPSYNGNIDTEGVVDLSILVLTQDVPNVTPSTLYRQAPTVGAVLTLAGYGVTGTGTTGVTDNSPTPQQGTIDFGTTPIDEVTGTFIKWNFDNKPAPNTESNTAPGDSGGPAFITVNGQLVLAGVTSGGSNDNAGYGDHSFDTRVDIATAWIDSIAGTSGATTGGGGSGGGGGSTPGTLSILSGPSATPNPAEPFQSVAFNCAASDSAATITWDFGDGTAPSTGSSVSHTYAQAGTYVVNVTAARNGQSDSGTTSVQVEVPTAAAMAIPRAHFALNFRSPYNSSLDLRMTHPDFAFVDRYSFFDRFDGRSFEFYIGNELVDRLDIYGSRAYGEGNANWNVRRGEITYKVRSEQLVAILESYGAKNETVQRIVTLPFAIRLDGKPYSGNYTFSYKGRAGSGGIGR
jgi:V8-like Glu-specific endopeptidase